MKGKFQLGNPQTQGQRDICPSRAASSQLKIHPLPFTTLYLNLKLQLINLNYYIFLLESIGTSLELHGQLIYARQIKLSQLEIWTWDTSLTP